MDLLPGRRPPMLRERRTLLLGATLIVLSAGLPLLLWRSARPVSKPPQRRVLFPVDPGAPRLYRITELTPAAESSGAYCINTRGHVVGYAVLEGRKRHAFLRGGEL